MKPIVLFGGTFDPVHHGHIAIAQAAADAFDPQKIIVLPAGNPYQRGRMPLAKASDRVAMLSMAMGLGTTKVVIDKRELHRTGPTYTFDTLRELRNELGEKIPFIWLIGSDAFAKIDTWKDWSMLFELTHFAVVMRPGDAPIESSASADLNAMISTRYRFASATDVDQSPAGCVILLKTIPPNVSSTDIRARLENGEAIRGLLPNTVCDYIEQHRLYLPSS